MRITGNSIELPRSIREMDHRTLARPEAAAWPLAPAQSATGQPPIKGHFVGYSALGAMNSPSILGARIDLFA
jgi:hypothetical protein